jgi:hypothetical protein
MTEDRFTRIIPLFEANGLSPLKDSPRSLGLILISTCRTNVTKITVRVHHLTCGGRSCSTANRQRYQRHRKQHRKAGPFFIELTISVLVLGLMVGPERFAALPAGRLAIPARFRAVAFRLTFHACRRPTDCQYQDQSFAFERCCNGSRCNGVCTSLTSLTPVSIVTVATARTEAGRVNQPDQRRERLNRDGKGADCGDRLRLGAVQCPRGGRAHSGHMTT